MKILINTAHQRFGGAIQVALSFIQECRSFKTHEFVVWVGPGVRKSLKEEEFPNNFQFQHFDFGIISLRKTYLINKRLQKAEKKWQPEVVISTSGPTYFHSQAPQIIGFNLGLYIYPESPFQRKLPFITKLKGKLKRGIHFYFFKRDADAYVVQTEDVNQRVQKALKTEEVFTATNTASQFYRERKMRLPKLPLRRHGRFRFVTISSYYPHKNLGLIPEVLSHLKIKGVENVDFVLTLKERDFDQHIGEHSNIFNVGPVPPEEGPGLYAECDGMFLPTLAECFSASYPEAMAMEKPIVTTDLGFARSICGEAALFFEPMNAKSAADQIIRLIGDVELQKNLISKGKRQLKTFDSPRDRAEKYIALCEKLGNNR